MTDQDRDRSNLPQYITCVDTSKLSRVDLETIKRQYKQTKDDGIARYTEPFLTDKQYITRDTENVSILQLHSDTVTPKSDDINMLNGIQIANGSDLIPETIIKKKRGRPRTEEKRKRRVNIESFAVNPITHLKGEQQADAPSFPEVKPGPVIDESLKSEYKETFFTSKDPRLITLGDCIQKNANFIHINNLPYKDFISLRSSVRATWGVRDPTAVFMGLPQKLLIPFESQESHMDRWPHCVGSKSYGPDNESPAYRYNIPNNPMLELYRLNRIIAKNEDFKKTDDTYDGHDKYHLKKTKLQIPHSDKPVYAGDTYMDITPSNIADYYSTLFMPVQSLIKPVFLKGSKSDTMVEMVRSIIDDKDGNPAFFSEPPVTKHKRGVHDNRYLRLFTPKETPEKLFEHISKYDLKQKKQRYEIRGESQPIYGYSKIPAKFAGLVLSDGITPETIKNGIDHLEYILPKSTDKITAMKNTDFRNTLKEHVAYLDQITQHGSIPDPSNELKRYCANFSLIYHPQFESIKRGHTYLIKTTELASYQLSDILSEKYDNVSYMNGDVPIRSAFPRRVDDIAEIPVRLNERNTGEKPEQKKKKTKYLNIDKTENKKLYKTYLQEHAFLQDSFYIRYLTETSIKNRLLLFGNCTDTKCPCKLRAMKRKKSDAGVEIPTKYAKNNDGSSSSSSSTSTTTTTTNTKQKSDDVAQSILTDVYDTESDKTRRRKQSEYQGRLPLHMFFFDNPTEKFSTTNTTIIKSLVFNLVTQVSENLSEMMMFVNSKDKIPDFKKDKKDGKQTADSAKQQSGVNQETSSTNDTSSKNKDSSTEDTWIISDMLKDHMDRHKDNVRCWYPPRRSLSYPHPLRKTYNTAKVTFYVHRLLATEVTFWNDRAQIISGSIVRNALQEHCKVYESVTGQQHPVDNIDQIISPFIPTITQLNELTDRTQNSTDKPEMIYHQDLVNYIQYGPIGTAWKNELHSAVRQLVSGHLKSQTRKNSFPPVEDVMVITDGFNIGVIHNKSLENLGSFRLHPENNANIPLVTASYHASFDREAGPGERPCSNGKECIRNKPKSRQDILDSKYQKSHAFIATEFLLPEEYIRFRYGDGKLPIKHKECIACNILKTNLLVARMRQHNNEPATHIQDHGVFVDCKDGYKLSDCLAPTYGSNDTLTGLVAPFPKYREENFVHVTQNGIRHAKSNNSATHFYMASITSLKKGKNYVNLESPQSPKQEPPTTKEQEGNRTKTEETFFQKAVRMTTEHKIKQITQHCLDMKI